MLAKRVDSAVMRPGGAAAAVPGPGAHAVGVERDRRAVAGGAVGIDGLPQGVVRGAAGRLGRGASRRGSRTMLRRDDDRSRSPFRTRRTARRSDATRAGPGGRRRASRPHRGGTRRGPRGADRFSGLGRRASSSRRPARSVPTSSAPPSVWRSCHDPPPRASRSAPHPPDPRDPTCGDVMARRPPPQSVQYDRAGRRAVRRDRRRRRGHQSAHDGPCRARRVPRRG